MGQLFYSDFENTIIVIIHHINAFIISHWNINVTQKQEKCRVTVTNVRKILLSVIRVFSRKYHLTTHQRVYTREKPFYRDHCDIKQHISM